MFADEHIKKISIWLKESLPQVTESDGQGGPCRQSQRTFPVQMDKRKSVVDEISKWRPGFMELVWVES